MQQALFQDNNKSLKDVQISLIVPVSWNGWKHLLEGAPLRTLLSGYLQKVVLLEPDELDEAHRYLDRAGRRDLLDFLLELGSQTRTDAAASQGVFPSTRPPPKFLMAYYFGRTMHQLQTAISASREAWLKVNEIVSEPASSSRAIEQAMADFNDGFSRNFRGLMVRAGIDNRGAINWRTAALLGFFRSLDASTDKPNPYLPCSFKAADREALIFS